MVPKKWWQDDKEPDLSQGDVIDQALFTVAIDPPQFLGRRESHGDRFWLEENNEVDPDGDGLRKMVVKAHVFPALIVSHSCEIDKNQKSTKRILVSPVVPIDMLHDREQVQRVLALRSKALFPLVDIPILGTCYTDFRRITPVQIRSLLAAGRHGSMTPEGRSRLHMHLIAFFARLGDKDELAGSDR